MLYDGPYSVSLDTYCRLNCIIYVIIYDNIGGALVYKYCIGQIHFERKFQKFSILALLFMCKMQHW